MKQILLCIGLLVLPLSWDAPAFAGCQAFDSTQTYSAGAPIPDVCDTHGARKVMTVDQDGNYVAGGGGGGGGDASAANQTTMIGHMDGLEGLITSTNTKLDTLDSRVDGLETNTASTNTKLDTVIGNLDGVETTLTAIDGRVDGLEGVQGTAADAAATAGSTGTISAKLRIMSGDIDAIKTAVQTLDNAISGNKFKVQLVDSSDVEIVVPTAGTTAYDAADASTNSTNVKASAGTIYGISVSNTTTTVYYLRLYNLAAAPTCSSGTGYVESIPIPPAAAAGQVGGREIGYNIGKAFTTGISYCITASSGSTANDSAAAGVFVSILYK